MERLSAAKANSGGTGRAGMSPRSIDKAAGLVTVAPVCVASATHSVVKRHITMPHLRIRPAPIPGSVMDTLNHCKNIPVVEGIPRYRVEQVHPDSSSTRFSNNSFYIKCNPCLIIAVDRLTDSGTCHNASDGTLWAGNMTLRHSL